MKTLPNDLERPVNTGQRSMAPAPMPVPKPVRSIAPMLTWLMIGVGLILGFVVVRTQMLSDNQAAAVFDAEIDALRQERIDAWEDAKLSDGALAPDVEFFRRGVATLRRAESELSGDDAVMAGIVADALSDLEPDLVAHAAVFAETVGAEGFTLDAIASLDQCQHVIDGLGRYSASLAALSDRMTAMPEGILQASTARGIERSQIERGLRELQSQMALRVRVNQLDIDSCDHLIEIAILLRDHWGDWEFNERHGLIARDPDVHRTIDFRLAAIDDLVAQQNALIERGLSQ